MEWGISYYKAEDDSVPGDDFLDGLPAKTSAHFYAVLEAVRAAPPPRFSGGGYWEAMHGSMNGYYEVRKRAKKEHHRLFCVLEKRMTRRFRSAALTDRRLW